MLPFLRYVIAVMRDMFATEPERRGLRVHGPGCCCAVAAWYQISFHLGFAGYRSVRPDRCMRRVAIWSSGVRAHEQRHGAVKT